MSNTIIIKNNTFAGNAPSANDLSVGELAINTADKKIFTKDSAGTVVELTGSGSSSGSSNSTSNGLFEHAISIISDYSIASGNNAISVGAITINSGVYVDIPSGSTWAII